MICIALLLDDDMQNMTRALSYKLHKTFNAPLAATKLPQHISLKQTFNCEALEEVVSYLEDVIKGCGSIPIELTELQLIKMPTGKYDTGILWIDVKETEALRAFHNKLNQELSTKFGIQNGSFDGEKFHFHSTITLGEVPYTEYEKMYNSIKNTAIHVNSQVNKMGIFYSPEQEAVSGSFMCYKIIEL